MTCCILIHSKLNSCLSLCQTNAHLTAHSFLLRDPERIQTRHGTFQLNLFADLCCKARSWMTLESKTLIYIEIFITPKDQMYVSRVGGYLGTHCINCVVQLISSCVQSVTVLFKGYNIRINIRFKGDTVFDNTSTSNEIKLC